jgi:lipopolysaccharide export system protein LptA
MPTWPGRRSPRFSQAGSRAVLLLATSLFLITVAAPALAGEKPKPPARKTKLNLKAKSILFDRGGGDIELKGDVHVTRTEGDEVMTVDCQHMTAKMKDGKLQGVLNATGGVVIKTGENHATAIRATFDVDKGIIRLYGTKKKPATLVTKQSKSWAEEIILYTDTEKVEMPNGGETELILEGPSEKKPEGK